MARTIRRRWDAELSPEERAAFERDETDCFRLKAILGALSKEAEAAKRLFGRGVRL